jgi:hypothetical protein
VTVVPHAMTSQKSVVDPVTARPGGTQIPPNAFDFVADIHELVSKVYHGDLKPKDVPRESSKIVLKLNKARELVANLPSIEKTLDEQLDTEKKLRERIAEQREGLKAAAEMNEVREAQLGHGEMETRRET